MRPISNFAARDVEALLHPTTNLLTHRSLGPLVLERARRHLCLRHRRQALHRGFGGPVVHGARVRQRRAGRDRARADVAPVLLASVRRAQPRAGDRAGREDQGDVAGAGLQGVLHQLGLGGQRHADQDRLVLQQRARPAQAQEDHCPPARLSRHHGRHRQPVGAFRVPRRFRPADRGHPPHRLPALLEERARGRERGGLCRPAGQEPRGADRA